VLQVFAAMAERSLLERKIRKINQILTLIDVSPQKMDSCLFPAIALIKVISEFSNKK